MKIDFRFQERFQLWDEVVAIYQNFDDSWIINNEKLVINKIYTDFVKNEEYGVFVSIVCNLERKKKSSDEGTSLPTTSLIIVDERDLFLTEHDAGMECYRRNTNFKAYENSLNART